MTNWMPRVAVLTLLGWIGSWLAAATFGTYAARGSWQASLTPALFLVGLICLVVTVIAALDLVFGGHRHRTGWQRCIHCGYDLRHTPNRCPECGRVPEKEPSRSD